MKGGNILKIKTSFDFDEDIIAKEQIQQTEAQKTMELNFV